MASDRYENLLNVGPVQGLDSTTAWEFIQPGFCEDMRNVSTTRYLQGLCNSQGRLNMTTLSNFSNYSVNAIVPYANTQTDQQYLICLYRSGYSPNIVLYDPATTTQPIGSISNAQTFDRGVQFYGTIYTNAGQQWSALNSGNMYAWQYPAPSGTTYGYSVVAGGAGSLPAATYYYCFTQVVAGPNGAFLQETTPTGNLPVGSPATYPYQVTIASAGGSVDISGTFTGTNSDGSTYTTNVYRQSTNTPVWTLLTNLKTNATYVDNLNDTQISANQQLNPNQDPPPVSPTNLGDIFIHQERIWVFSYFDDQSQLWYSGLGTPWQFNQLEATLVGNSATNTNLSYTGYGDAPVKGVSMGGAAILFKTRSSYLLTGVDPDSYYVQPLFPIGCMAWRSAINILGQVYWLAEDGPYTYNGLVPQWLGQQIRNDIRAISYYDRQQAVSFFSNMTWYLSFPTINVTYGFYIPTGQWTEKIGYATNYAASVPANPRFWQSSPPTQYVDSNEVLAARVINGVGTNQLDWWFVTETDLGSPQTAYWFSPLTSLNSPSWEKTYRYITVTAPQQSGTCQVTLYVDPGMPTAETFTTPVIDLSTGATRHIFAVQPTGNPGQGIKGFQARLYITFSTTSSPSSPIQISRVDVWGTHDRNLTIPN